MSNNDFKEIVKARLKAAKKRSGLTCDEIAERSGMSLQTVHFSFARCTPLNQKVLTLKCICDAMDYPFSELFADERLNEKIKEV